MDPAKAMQAEAFYGHYHRFVTTTDIEFASAAITAMMVDEVPTFTKYYQVGERFVLQLNPVEEDWDPQEDDSLPVPKDYAGKRKDATALPPERFEISTPGCLDTWYKTGALTTEPWEHMASS